MGTSLQSEKNGADRHDQIFVANSPPLSPLPPDFAYLICRSHYLARFLMQVGALLGGPSQWGQTQPSH